MADEIVNVFPQPESDLTSQAEHDTKKKAGLKFLKNVKRECCECKACKSNVWSYTYGAGAKPKPEASIAAKNLEKLKKEVTDSVNKVVKSVKDQARAYGRELLDSLVKGFDMAAYRQRKAKALSSPLKSPQQQQQQK